MTAWSVSPDYPPHRLPERSDCRLRPTHQHLRLITQLRTVLDKPPGSLTRILCSLPHFLRKHRAAVKMTRGCRSGPHGIVGTDMSDEQANRHRVDVAGSSRCTRNTARQRAPSNT